MNYSLLVVHVLVCLTFSAARGQLPQKKALITGIIGQDGSYLAEFLQTMGYKVYGVDKQIQQNNVDKYFSKDVTLYEVDICDTENIKKLLAGINPDEIYNLAAQSNVATSYESPESTATINSLAPLKLLELLKRTESLKKSRFFQAASCEIFGNTQECPQHENTIINPQSPYGISKAFAYWFVKTYREAFGLFACNGILYNHESPRRPPTFVTRKIIQAVVRIKYGLQDVLEIGNLDARKDWGHARDYVRAMWLMLQQEKASDYVIASGETHSVREFVESAFKTIGMHISWQGKGIDEVGIDQASGHIVVKVNRSLFRPLEGGIMQGNTTKARELLHWQPKITFYALIQEMMDEELKQMRISSPATQLVN
jgi:GDPmannose 4,6-dehydratase